jgi:hypothetical protein
MTEVESPPFSSGFVYRSVFSDSFSTFGGSPFRIAKPRWAPGSKLDAAIDAASKDSFLASANMIYNRRVRVFSTTASAKLIQGFALAANGGFPPSTTFLLWRRAESQVPKRTTLRSA